jgi:hypothetical protein
MPRTEIYIDNQLINQVEGAQPMALTLRLDAQEAPGQISGYFAKRPITIPADKQTLAVFGDWIDGDPNLAVLNRKPCRIDVDGVSVFRGVAQLDSVFAGNGSHRRNARRMEAVLTANNAAWFGQMKTILVKDIVSTYIAAGTIWNDTFVAANDNKVPSSSAWCLFLGKVKDWSNTDTIEYTDLTFGVFITQLITKAFNLCGYAVDSTWFTHAEVQRYILPLPSRPFPVEFGAGYELRVKDAANTQTFASLYPTYEKVIMAADQEFFDPGTLFDLGNSEYDVPFTGEYEITYGGKADGNDFFRVANIANTVFTPALIAAGTNDYIEATETIFLYKGDKMSLYFATDDGITKTPGIFTFLIRPVFNFKAGYEINLGVLTPDTWNMADLLLGFTRAFNLQLSTNLDTGRVRIEPQDGYYIGSTFYEGFYQDTTRVDFTTKIDLSKEAEHKANNEQALKLRLQWATDSGDANAEQVDRNSLLPSFSAAYNYPTDRFEDGENVVTIPFFSKSIMYNANEIRHPVFGGAKTPLLPILQLTLLDTDPVAEGEDTGPRILYYAGRRAGLDGYVARGLGSPYDYPAAWFFNYNDAAGSSPSLSFSDETPNAYGSATLGLASRYWLQRIGRTEWGETVKEWVFWKTTDILNLDFRKKLLIDGRIYILKEIDGYLPGYTGSRKTVLEADYILPASRVSALENTNIQGLFR